MGIIGDRVRFGAAYYAEYHALRQADGAQLTQDLRLMHEAGFDTIRVGESVWSTWEPRDGVFDTEWLLPVLDAAREHGIDVVLGTPTYAVPPWLQRAHPEIAGESATGVRIPWGVRQEADIHHPVFRRYAERIIRTVVGRYADHPAVIGFQVDNEPGEHLLFNDHVFEAFVARLRDEYGTVDALNDAWGLTHWAHRLAEFDELWRPDGNHVPQYDLAWRRFQADLVSEYIAWQAGIVREYARPDQFVTTCIDYARKAVDDLGLGAPLDVTSCNLYLGMQDGLDAATRGEVDWPPTGAWAPFQVADRAWATRDEPFVVTETNATSVGHPWFNFPAYDGQWRQVVWAFVARGARAIEYWHWHTLHASWESSWTGILPHSLEPGRVYREIARIGAELRAAGRAIEGLVPDARVGLLVDQSSRWAMQYHPPFQAPNTGVTAGDESKQGLPDRESYDRILYRFHGGLTRAGEQVRMLHLDRFVERMRRDGADAVVADLPALVAAGLVVADDAALTALRDYAAAGGHLVLGMRTGYADHGGRMRTDPQPAGLAEPAGVRYDEYSNLAAPIAVRGAIEGRAERWIEGLEADGAEVVATYDHPHFGRWAAVTSVETGLGRITTVGTLPDLDLATAIGRFVGDTLPDAPRWDGRVSAHSAVNADGERLWFVHNFSFDSVTITPPVDVVALDGAPVDPLELGPWDVAVLRAGDAS